MSVIRRKAKIFICLFWQSFHCFWYSVLAVWWIQRKWKLPWQILKWSAICLGQLLSLVECENKKLTEVSYHQKCSKNIIGASFALLLWQLWRLVVEEIVGERFCLHVLLGIPSIISLEERTLGKVNIINFDSIMQSGSYRTRYRNMQKSSC